MPRRISSGPAPTSIHRSAKKKVQKTKNRSLNAFAIASAENPDVPKSRRNRLGNLEEDPQDRKRRRLGDEDLNSEDDGPSQRPTKSARVESGELSDGSDSEGNTWRMGHVDEDDDSELDSDEAFGEEDELKFAGYSFFGSSKKQQAAGKTNGQRDADSNEDMNLDEQESDDDESRDNDSLGSDGVDLADMLDNYSDDDDDGKGDKNSEVSGSESESQSVSEDDKGDFDAFSSDEDDLDSSKLSKLQNLVSSLHPTSEPSKKSQGLEFHESKLPSVSGLISSEKFDIQDLLDSTTDPQLAKISKRVGAIPKRLKKDLKLAPALPQRQKDRLDRIAANEKATKNLNRWVDTIKHMRRADHLTFPLQDPEAAVMHGSEHLLPRISSAPVNDLESTINSILEESGLAPDDERGGNQFSDCDELPENKVSVQDILVKRAELRRARDILFREEQRAKRIKKIKSKSYRRVHRRDREKLSALDRNAFVEGGGSDMDEEEQESHDRRRAAERMGAKHRDSKWAKQMKRSGRTIWDDDARSGVSEMARRNEELRKRIAGKDLRGEESDIDANMSSDEEDENSDQGDDAARLRTLRKTLDKLKDGSANDQSVTGLSSMKFMKRAEAARKAQNLEDIARMSRELDGSYSSDESEDENIGRKIFGPSSGRKAEILNRDVRNEFEEQESVDEDGRGSQPDAFTNPSAPNLPGTSHEPAAAQLPMHAPFKNTKSLPAHHLSAKEAVEGLETSKPKIGAVSREIHSAPDMDGWTTVTYDHRSNSDEKDSSDAESLVSQTEILRRAFAGDDVEKEFKKEKDLTVAEEDEKMIDNSLPGWGNWVGDGVSKRELKRNKGKLMTKQEGIKPRDRKDAKLKNVIINQKRLKKNVDYLASTLPFPFTARSEYERSIRMPIGTEWNVKHMYQAGTKPRVIVKPGRIVAPMDKPVV